MKLNELCGPVLSVSETGNEIAGSKTYAMGDFMYFEAKQRHNRGSSANQRIYIDKCFVTASPRPDSSPTYALIDNHG